MSLSQDIAQLEDELESARAYVDRLDKLCGEQEQRIGELEEFYYWVEAYHPEIITAHNAAKRLEN